MVYIKFEARQLDADHWLKLSPAAFTVHTWALSWCNEQATDGLMPKIRADRLNCPVAPASLPGVWAELVAAGIWEDTGDAYHCPTFLAHGLAAAEQHSTRAKWAEDKRRQRLHSNGNHTLCTPRSCRGRAAELSTESGLSTGGQGGQSPPFPPRTSGRLDQTRPDQTQPVRVGEWDGAAAAAAASADATTTTTPPQGKHHCRPGCCPLSGHPANRHHWQPDECPGCDDPDHEKSVA